jgi:hypothetical protein
LFEAGARADGDAFVYVDAHHRAAGPDEMCEHGRVRTSGPNLQHALTFLDLGLRQVARVHHWCGQRRQGLAVVGESRPQGVMDRVRQLDRSAGGGKYLAWDCTERGLDRRVGENPGLDELGDHALAQGLGA